MPPLMGGLWICYAADHLNRDGCLSYLEVALLEDNSGVIYEKTGCKDQHSTLEN